MFKPDIPISARSDDLLGRTPFSRAFGKALLEYRYQDSIVTALYGGWGSGKSSIINMAREYIRDESADLGKNERPVLLEFNPWNHADQSHLISQFFKVLSSTLKRQEYGKQASAIGKKLEAYSHFFSPLAMIPDPAGIGVTAAIATSSALRAAGKATSAWGAAYSKDLQHVRGELNALLAAETRKIIIVIDDIDRLPDVEVRQIFQMVKMLGDFPNTIYILSFDRDVVSRALDDVQAGSGGAYLEKIVQFPIEVPPVGRAEIEKLLFAQLNDILLNVPEDRFDTTYWGNVYHEGVKHFFRSLRDVTRYVNALKFSFEMVRTEVNAIDFIATTALQVFEPALYLGIRDNKSLFVQTLSDGYGGSDREREQAKTRLDDIFKRASLLGVDTTRQLLSRLFPQVQSIYENFENDSRYIDQMRAKGRICHEDNFDTFFRLAIPEGEISKTEMAAILEFAEDSDGFAEALRSLSRDGRINRYLVLMLDYTKDQIPIENAPNIVGVLMNIGDSFPEDQVGMFDASTSVKILRIVYQLVQRLDSQEERFDLLRPAMVNAEDSLWPVVHEVRALEREHGKRNPEGRIPPEEERTVSAEQLSLLEQIALAKIREWAKAGKLSSHKNFVEILYRWKELAPADSYEIRAFVDELLETTEGLAIFVAAFLYQGTTQTIGDSVSSRTWRLNPENIANFTETKAVTARLRKLRNSTQFSNFEKKTQIAVELFLDTVDGKVEKG